MRIRNNPNLSLLREGKLPQKTLAVRAAGWARVSYHLTL